MMFAWRTQSADSCYLAYLPSANYLYLFNDAGTNWLPPATLGSGTLQNSQCSIDLANSSASGSGNDLFVTVKVTFKQPWYVGPQNVFSAATDDGNLNSGWQSMGTWTGVAANYSQPPSVSYSPPGGIGYTGTLSVIATDLNGQNYVAQIYMRIASTFNSSAKCEVLYDPYWNGLYLMNDANTDWSGPVLPGAAGVALENSRCSLNAGLTTVISTVDGWTVNAALTFKPGFEGMKEVWVAAIDRAEASSNWQHMGDWDVRSDFSISVPGSDWTVGSGGGGIKQVIVTSIGGFTGGVSMSYSGQPPGSICGWSPYWYLSLSPNGSASTNFYCTYIPPGAPAGLYTVTLTGTSGTIVHQATFKIHFNETGPSYLLSLSPSSQNVTTSPYIDYTVTLTAKNGFTGPVDLTWTPAQGVTMPTGATLDFYPTQLITAGQSTLHGYVPITSTPGTYPFTVIGGGGVATVGGSFQVAAAPPVTHHITSSPPGRLITLGSTVGSTTTYTNCIAPCDLSWIPGTAHSIGTTPRQLDAAGTTQYSFTSWSDSGAATHSLTAQTTSTTYAATFSTQYSLVLRPEPWYGGSVVANPPYSTGFTAGWYTPNATVQIGTTANPGTPFVGFSGDLSGSTTPQSLSMSGPMNIVANFSAFVTILTNPAGLAVKVDGVSCDLPCSVPWANPIGHVIAVDSPQPATGETNARYSFASWSDSGAASHTISISATSYIATFTKEYYLTTQVSPAGAGTISLASQWIAAGTSNVQITATSGSSPFSTFSGDLTGSTNPQTISMDSAKSVVANFGVPPPTSTSKEYIRLGDRIVAIESQ